MAEHFLPLGLAAVNPAVDNYEKAWHPVKNQAKKLPVRRKSKKNRDNRDNYGYDDREEDMRTPEERGLILKPRREVGSDEEIVEIVPKGQLIRRPDGAMSRRASSVDGSQRGYRNRGRGRDREGVLLPLPLPSLPSHIPRYSPFIHVGAIIMTNFDTKQLQNEITMNLSLPFLPNEALAADALNPA